MVAWHNISSGKSTVLLYTKSKVEYENIISSTMKYEGINLIKIHTRPNWGKLQSSDERNKIINIS